MLVASFSRIMLPVMFLANDLRNNTMNSWCCLGQKHFLETVLIHGKLISHLTEFKGFAANVALSTPSELLCSPCLNGSELL